MNTTPMMTQRLGHLCARWLLALAAILMGAPLAAQTTGVPPAKARIHWNARMDDGHSVSLRTTFDTSLHVEALYVVARGRVKREAVECRHMQSTVLSTQPLAFSFACDFEYQGTNYRLRGQYSANAAAAQQSLRCIPLTLGKDLIEQGGYQK